MKNQQGATLIMVLIVLLLVSAVATIAMKTGMFGLRLATNSQVDNLLIENSNAALFNLGNPDSRTVERRLASNNIYGYFTSDATAEDTMVFCYRSNQTEFFSMRRAGTLDGERLGSNGWCGENDFSGGRNAVISQIFLQRGNDADDDSRPLQGYRTGVSIGQGAIGLIPMRMDASAISILPGFSDTDRADIVRCLNEFNDRSDNMFEGVTTCLSDASVPYSLQSGEFMVGTDYQKRN